MRLLRLWLAVLVVAVPAVLADVQTIYDTWGQTPTCSSLDCIDTKDVIGDRAWFDIEKIVVSVNQGSTLGFSIFTNYQNPDLAPFKYSSQTFSIGDLFFGVSGSSYGVPLYGHGSFAAGNMYQIGVGGVDTQTAYDVLGLGSGWVYRPGETVWLTSGSNPSPVGTGSVTRSVNGDGSSVARYMIDVSLAPSPTFWSGLSDSGGQMWVQFASATCGNDIIKGSVAVPEPDAWLLFGALLVGLLARVVPRRSS